MSLLKLLIFRLHIPTSTYNFIYNQTFYFTILFCKYFSAILVVYPSVCLSVCLSGCLSNWSLSSCEAFSKSTIVLRREMKYQISKHNKTNLKKNIFSLWVTKTFHIPTPGKNFKIYKILTILWVCFSHKCIW